MPQRRSTAINIQLWLNVKRLAECKSEALDRSFKSNPVVFVFRPISRRAPTPKTLHSKDKAQTDIALNMKVQVLLFQEKGCTFQ